MKKTKQRYLSEINKESPLTDRERAIYLCGVYAAVDAVQSLSCVDGGIHELILKKLNLEKK